MKISKIITGIFLFVVISIGLTSCLVRRDYRSDYGTTYKHDNGRHNGWYKKTPASHNDVIIVKSNKGKAKGHNKK